MPRLHIPKTRMQAEHTARGSRARKRSKISTYPPLLILVAPPPATFDAFAWNSTKMTASSVYGFSLWDGILLGFRYCSL